MDQKRKRIKVVFDGSVKKQILGIFDKEVDSQGYIREKSTSEEHIVTQSGEEIKLERFAGIRKGSEVFLKSDLPTHIELADDSE